MHERARESESESERGDASAAQRPWRGWVGLTCSAQSSGAAVHVPAPNLLGVVKPRKLLLVDDVDLLAALVDHAPAAAAAALLVANALTPVATTCVRCTPGVHEYI